MRISVSVLIILCTLIFKESSGQTFDPRCHRSTEGKEFWFGFMEGRNSDSKHYNEITVTAREATSFQVYIGKNPVPYNSYSLGNNSSQQIKIDWHIIEPLLSERFEEKAIHIVSEKPVNVYALNWAENSADVAVVYPVESLGKEYYAMCFYPHVRGNNSGVITDRNSEFLVVASEDSTTVVITPSKVTDQLKPADTQFTIVLNKGEVYQVQSMNRNNLPGQGDLTGSHIKSDKPVAVFSGIQSGTIPETVSCCFDHIVEQMPPLEAWGREYYTVPLATRRTDLYRIMASEDNTRVLIGTRAPVTLQRGRFYEFLLYYNEPTRIFSNKPILVAQYSMSNDIDKEYTGGDGDPFMIVLSPVSQSKNDVTFVAYYSNQIKKYYVNIVIPTSEVNNIFLDNTSISGYFTPYPGTRFSYAQVPTYSGEHRLMSTNPNRGFLAYVYGYGGYESYGYGVGFNLDLVLDLGESIDFQGDTLALCHGDSIVLDAGPYFDSFGWSSGDTTQRITVKSGGHYWAHASTVDGCHQYDSIFIYVSNPKTYLGNDTVGCPFSKVLDPGGVFAKYEWSTGESSRNITVSEPGEYSVRVTDRYGCTDSDTLKFGFYQVPTVKLKGEQLLCGELSGTLTAEVMGGNNNWSYVPPPWKSDQPSRVKYDKQSGSSAGFTVTDWGKYTFIYSLTTTDNCVAADSLVTGIYEIPTSSFDFVDKQGDPCAGYSREIIYTGNATPAAKMNWDFGGCSFDSLDWNRGYVSFAPFGSHPFVSLFVEENGCVGDSTRKAFGASPDFTMNTDKSQACDSDLIRFSGTLNVPDQLNFEWDFGDGSGSTEQFPVHLYNTAGFYDVRLTITNPVTGCQAGFLVGDMVKIYKTPVSGFEVDYPVAFLGQSHLTFTNKTEYGDYYRWSFGDGSASEASDPSHTYVQAGKYPVSLMAESGMGCRDTSVMTVEILPSALFTPNAFRPGSSIAENRVFMPVRSGVDPEKFQLRIFNRWGQQVFGSKSPDHPWDGKLKNGKDAPMGNYIWRVDYTDIQGFPHMHKGQVLLVR